MNTPLENNPIRHTQKIKAQMCEILNHLRDELGDVTDAKALALFETSTEVLGGLVKAYEDYEEHNQNAWRAKFMASLPKGRAYAARR